jgi:hypothetical protein
MACHNVSGTRSSVVIAADHAHEQGEQQEPAEARKHALRQLAVDGAVVAAGYWSGTMDHADGRLRFATAHLAAGPRFHDAEQGDPDGETILVLPACGDSWFSHNRQPEGRPGGPAR